MPIKEEIKVRQNSCKHPKTMVMMVELTIVISLPIASASRYISFILTSLSASMDVLSSTGKELVEQSQSVCAFMKTVAARASSSRIASIRGKRG